MTIFNSSMTVEEHNSNTEKKKKYIYTVSQKTSPTFSTFSTVTLKPIKTNYQIVKFLYEYSWHNLPSNNNLVFHLTQRLFLYHLGKSQPVIYLFYPVRYDCLTA